MVQDPEARATSSSAMIIGIVVLVLLVAGILWFTVGRGPDTTAVVPTGDRDTTVVNNPPSPPSSTVVVPSAPDVEVEGGGAGTTKTDTTETTETTTTETDNSP